MKKVTPWSLLIIFGGLPVLLIAINKASPANPTSDATTFAVSLFDSIGQFVGIVFLVVAVMIIGGWMFTTETSGF